MGNISSLSMTPPVAFLGGYLAKLIISALKMDTARFSETSAYTNQSTRRLNPQEHRYNRQRRENLKSHAAF
jgi:hypothetical protein